MQGIRSPRHLPGAEVRLAALFVEVSKNQEEQHRDDAWNDDDASGHTVHCDLTGQKRAGHLCAEHTDRGRIFMFSQGAAEHNKI